MPFRLVAVRDDAHSRLADLFEDYARRSGKTKKSIHLERSRALQVLVTIAIVARIDLSHPVVPADEQWACVGGAITNVLNALHLLGYARKLLSGGKVRDQQIVNAFCQPGETLLGWIAVDTRLRTLSDKHGKSEAVLLSNF